MVDLRLFIARRVQLAFKRARPLSLIGPCELEMGLGELGLEESVLALDQVLILCPLLQIVLEREDLIVTRMELTPHIR
mgnify:CR=1 FL=1|jgi:hypothetical protein